MVDSDTDDLPLAERVRRKFPELAQPPPAAQQQAGHAGGGAAGKRKHQGDETDAKRPRTSEPKPKRPAGSGGGHTARGADGARKSRKDSDKDGEDAEMRALMMPPKKGVRQIERPVVCERVEPLLHRCSDAG